MLQHGRVLLVDRVESPEFIHEAVHRLPKNRVTGRVRAERDIGRELPTHTTALGKILLAHLPPAGLAEHLPALVLTRSTSKSLVSKAKLVASLEIIRKQGYAIADEEEYVGVRAVSVPIYDAGNTVRAAVSLNGSPRQAAWSDEYALVGRLQAAAHDISKRSALAF